MEQTLFPSYYLIGKLLLKFQEFLKGEKESLVVDAVLNPAKGSRRIRMDDSLVDLAACSFSVTAKRTFCCFKARLVGSWNFFSDR